MKQAVLDAQDLAAHVLVPVDFLRTEAERTLRAVASPKRHEIGLVRAFAPVQRAARLKVGHPALSIGRMRLPPSP